jgi:hypothetical protein
LCYNILFIKMIEVIIFGTIVGGIFIFRIIKNCTNDIQTPTQIQPTQPPIQQTIISPIYNEFNIFSVVYIESKNEELKDCSICLEEIKVGDQIRRLTCFHQYHINCIDEWLDINKICPECNQEFK